MSNNTASHLRPIHPDASIPQHQVEIEGWLWNRYSHPEQLSIDDAEKVLWGPLRHARVDSKGKGSFPERSPPFSSVTRTWFWRQLQGPRDERDRLLGRAKESPPQPAKEATITYWAWSYMSHVWQMRDSGVWIWLLWTLYEHPGSFDDRLLIDSTGSGRPPAWLQQVVLRPRPGVPRFRLINPAWRQHAFWGRSYRQYWQHLVDECLDNVTHSLRSSQEHSTGQPSWSKDMCQQLESLIQPSWHRVVRDNFSPSDARAILRGVRDWELYRLPFPFDDIDIWQEVKQTASAIIQLYEDDFATTDMRGLSVHGRVL